MSLSDVSDTNFVTFGIFQFLYQETHPGCLVKICDPQTVKIKGLPDIPLQVTALQT